MKVLFWPVLKIPDSPHLTSPLRHLYLRDLNAVPGLKMSQALAQQLGPQVGAGQGYPERLYGEE